MEQSKARLKKREPLPTTKILICDDHPLFLVGLRTFLERQEGICIVGEAHNAEELVRQAERTRPSIIFLDMSTARRNEFEVLQQLKGLCPDAKVLILVGYATPIDLVGAIQAGVLGFLLKKSDPNLILRAIRTIQEGKPWIQREFTPILFKALQELAPEEAPVYKLSRRERAVLHLIARGLSNKEIAQQLNITVWTVKVHVSHILNKLKVRKRTEAARYALLLIEPQGTPGIISSDDKKPLSKFSSVPYYKLQRA